MTPQDRRRLGSDSPTAAYSPGEEITLCDPTSNGQVIARVKITGRIRDYSIQVTELSSYDGELCQGKITWVGKERRYNREVGAQGERLKIFRKIDILQGPVKAE
jgi:hypothetical protein